MYSTDPTPESCSAAVYQQQVVRLPAGEMISDLIRQDQKDTYLP